MLKDLTDRAAVLAMNAHEGQVDKQGRDYFKHHLIPVAEMLRPFGENAYMAGLLHDIIEDTPTNIEDLEAAGFPGVVVDAVWSVTRRGNEPYERLIRRSAAHRLGRLVKLADNWLNLSGLDGLAKTDPATADRLRGKYMAAREVLERSLAGATVREVLGRSIAEA